jgi:hypothetical protein
MHPAVRRACLALWLTLAACVLGAGCAREDRPPPSPSQAPRGADAPTGPPAPAASRATGAAGEKEGPAPQDAGSDGGPDASAPAKPPCRCLYDLEPTTRSMRICEIEEPDYRGSTKCVGPNK